MASSAPDSATLKAKFDRCIFSVFFASTTSTPKYPALNVTNKDATSNDKINMLPFSSRTTFEKKNFLHSSLLVITLVIAYLRLGGQ